MTSVNTSTVFQQASGVSAAIIIDSSGAAQNEVLPAATGSGSIQYYINHDLTNTADLSPQSGESLNGVIDGTFLFSNYSAGTQFRADDKAAGEWVISVVGEGSSSAYQTQAETLVYAGSAVEGVSYTHNRTQAASSNPGTGEVFVRDLRIIRRYIGAGQAAVKIYGSAVIDQDNDVIITLPTGTLTDPFIVDKRAIRPEVNVTDYITTTVAVDQITINRDDDINDDSPLYFEAEGLGNWVGEQPDATVLAGMLTPESLGMAKFSLATDSASAVICPLDTTDFNDISGLSIDGLGNMTVPAGRYIFHGVASRASNSVTWEIYDSTNGVAIVNGADINGNGNVHAGSSMPYTVPAGGATIHLREAGGDSSIVWNGSSAAGINFRTEVAITQLSSSQVVLPEALSVGPNEVLEGSLKSIGASSSLTLLDGGRTWNDLIAEYEFIRFEFVTQAGGFDHFSDRTVRSTDLTLNSRVRALDGDGGGSFVTQIVMDNAFTSGDATGAFNGWTSQSVRVIGVMAQQNVINTDDVAVNDQSASGYYDIGPIRHQWGQHAHVGAGASPITFPAPFADATYSITGNAIDSVSATQTRFISYINRTTTDVDSMHLFANSNGSPAVATGSVHTWIAIGLKP